MRGDNLDMLTMLDEAKSELGIKFLMLRIEPIEPLDTPETHWRFFLADPASPAGRQVFSVSIDCPPRSTFDTVKDVLKRQLLAHRPGRVAC